MWRDGRCGRLRLSADSGTSLPSDASAKLRGVGPRIALTFDDGPSRWTPAILDLLAAAGARATFFVLGQSIEGREDVLRRIAAEGHELGNHGHSHRDMRELSDAEIADELRSTADRIEALGLARPRLVRPPYGEGAERLERLGVGPVVLWSIDTLDWRDDADSVVGVVLAEARDGAVVLLHDGRPSGDSRSSVTREATVEAVGRVLRELRRRGFGFVPVGELAEGSG
jgi:peptidoglycan/xylan/chitin deacetylase (PgdA/CDA1 family)